MKFEVRYVDVSAYLAAGKQPVMMLERALAHGHEAKGGLFGSAEVGRPGAYWVPKSPILLSTGVSEAITWSVTYTGAHVHVPIEAYRTNEKALANVVGLGVQIGLVAMDSLGQYTRERPTVVVLLIGHECQVVEDAFRCFVGMAIRTG